MKALRSLLLYSASEAALPELMGKNRLEARWEKARED